MSAPPQIPPIPKPGVPAPESHRALTLTLAFLGIGILTLLALVEPAGQVVFPRCWLNEMTGLRCPGCGGTRAVHALLNGDPVRAWRLNPLVVTALPVMAWWSLRGLRGGWTGLWWKDPTTHPVTLTVMGGLIVGFGIGRNLSW